MSGFFHLSAEVQELIYAMTHVARFSISVPDRAFASQMVSASHDHRWQPDENALHRMRMLSLLSYNQVRT